MAYKNISMDEAKKIFESGEDGSYIILDVRRSDEFASGHIPFQVDIYREQSMWQMNQSGQKRQQNFRTRIS